MQQDRKVIIKKKPMLRGYDNENIFLSLSKKGKNNWWRFLLFIASLIILPVIASIIIETIELSNFRNKESEFIWNIITEGIAFSIVLMGIILAIRIIHKRSFFTLNGVRTFRAAEFFEGAIIWGVLIIIGSLFNQQEQWKYFFYNGLNNSYTFIIPIIILAIAIQSYTEEVVFRGYLLQSLALRIKNINLLILICSSLFGILHAGDGFAAIIATTFFGCLNCYTVIKRNNLAFVTGVHSINNILFVYILGDRNPAENDIFLKFDFEEYSILISQFILLYIYVRYKDSI